MKQDLKTPMGNVKVVFAEKRCRSICSTIVKNRDLSLPQMNRGTNQKCNKVGCKQCCLAITDDMIVVNGKSIDLPKHLNCKSRNTIYCWTCQLCKEDIEKDYIGRSVQKSHKRTNGHRTCFNTEKYEKSALSMHAKEMHLSNISLEHFRIGLVKQVPSRNIKREEFRYIDKFRTNTLGLNRYKVAN